MFVEAALTAWSGLALAWWLIAWRLVAQDAASPRETKPAPEDGTLSSPSLTIFKPLAPVGLGAFDPRGLESFLAQMGSQEELLLGVHEADRARVMPWLERTARDFPLAALRVIWRTEPDAAANPKVSWLKMLATHATGELWLWSDADIVAPPGFLRTARSDYATGAARLWTWPYAVGETESAPALLDTLYVNAEFFPGVLLLRRLGPVDFGLGAALLFSRADFEQDVSWGTLGAALADDFVLGRRLKPVRLGRVRLTTRAEAATWRAAVLHYLRWSKTVRWNRPGGAAARIVVLPALGWLALIAFRPGDTPGWLGLVAVMQMDVLFALLLCRRAGCALRLRDFAGMEFWSVGRALAWAACWLPWPVTWSGRRWWRPFDEDSIVPPQGRN